MNNNDIEIFIEHLIGARFYVLKNSNLDLSDKNTKDIIHTVKMLNNKYYYNNKLIHREDGPAVEWKRDSRKYLIRRTSPAMEYLNGSKEWFLNGLRHRLDGPALELPNGYKEYYINGNKISEENFYLEKELRESIINNKSSKKNKL